MNERTDECDPVVVVRPCRRRRRRRRTLSSRRRVWRMHGFGFILRQTALAPAPWQ